MSDDKSITIGGSAIGNVFVIGDQNSVQHQYQTISLPRPEQVDIGQELAALRKVLARLPLEDQAAGQVEKSLDQAEQEAKSSSPDKNSVGRSLERVLTVAGQAEKFLQIIDTLRPHVINAAAWLGQNWYKLLGLVGLSSLP